MKNLKKYRSNLYLIWEIFFAIVMLIGSIYKLLGYGGSVGSFYKAMYAITALAIMFGAPYIIYRRYFMQKEP